MARETDLKHLVETFAADLEAAVTARVNAEWTARFDELRAKVLGGETVPATRRRGPAPGIAAELKPCPVCGTPNKARRFSYLCENDRSPENLAKYKGARKPARAAS